MRHELRTPLTSIRGYIETLLDDEALDASTRRRFLKTARRETLRLGRLVEGMLEFSMLDLSPAAPAWCDIAEETSATVEAALPLARARGVALHSTVDRTAVARIDPDAFVHALLNLIENGIKHGRVSGTVQISCEREGAFHRVAVDDDGPGVAWRERDAIFAMGRRGHGARRPGNGIGLAIVKAIVDRAGGDVRAERSALGGARFVLRIPAGVERR